MKTKKLKLLFLITTPVLTSLAFVACATTAQNNDSGSNNNNNNNNSTTISRYNAYGVITYTKAADNISISVDELNALNSKTPARLATLRKLVLAGTNDPDGYTGLSFGRIQTVDSDLDAYFTRNDPANERSYTMIIRQPNRIASGRGRQFNGSSVNFTVTGDLSQINTANQRNIIDVRSRMPLFSFPKLTDAEDALLAKRGDTSSERLALINKFFKIVDISSAGKVERNFVAADLSNLELIKARSPFSIHTFNSIHDKVFKFQFIQLDDSTGAVLNSEEIKLDLA